MEKEKCENKAGGHQWNYDKEKGKWVCLRCGKESIKHQVSSPKLWKKNLKKS